MTTAKLKTGLCVSVCLVKSALFCAFSAGAQVPAPEQRELGLLFVDWRERNVALQSLDGTVEQYDLPMAVGYHIPGAWGMDITPSGKMVYLGAFSEMPKTGEPMRVSR